MERTQIEPTHEAPRTIHLVEVRDALDGVLEGYTTREKAKARIIFAAGMGDLVGDWQLTDPADAPYRVARIGDDDNATLLVFGVTPFPAAHAYGLLLLLARRLDERPVGRPFATLQLYAAINTLTDDMAARVVVRDLAPKPTRGESAHAYASRLRALAEEL